MKNIKTFFLLLFLLNTYLMESQVGFGTNTPNSTSIIDLKSITKGILAPRMTSLQRDSIENPAEGLLIYNTSKKGFNYYDTNWQDFSTNVFSKNGTGDIITSSNSSEVIPEMTISPPEGTYLVDFNTQIINNSIPSDVVDSSQLLMDLTSAKNQLNTVATTNSNHSFNFGNGETLLPGKYVVDSAIAVAGTLTFNAGGNPNALFIINAKGAINTYAGTRIILAGGALPQNIFWLAEGVIGIGLGGIIKGILISNGFAIAVGNSTILDGRIFTTNGAIAFGTGTVSITPNSAFIQFGSLSTFVLFTGAGPINNTGASTYNGNICAIGGNTDSILAGGSTINGTLFMSEATTSSLSDFTLATFGIYQNGVLIPNSTRTITCSSNYANLSLKTIANIALGQEVDVRWSVNYGNLVIGNRMLTLKKVQ